MEKCTNCGSTEFVESHAVKGFFKCKCCGLHLGEKVESNKNFRKFDLTSQN